MFLFQSSSSNTLHQERRIIHNKMKTVVHTEEDISRSNGDEVVNWAGASE